MGIRKKAPMTVLREKLSAQAVEIRSWERDDTTVGQDRMLQHAATMLRMAAFMIACVQAGCIVELDFA